MDATWIITAFVLIDTLMERLNHQSDIRAHLPDSEVILIAVLSAKWAFTPALEVRRRIEHPGVAETEQWLSRVR